MALNVTRLVCTPDASSLLAIEVSCATLVPVKIPSRVSKSLPAVLIVTWPDLGAVHVHHTDLPPVLPAMFGSLASFVALTFVPVTVADEPVIAVRLAKLLFAGPAGVRAILSVMLPETPL